MPEATTYGATVIALQEIDRRAQVCEETANTCGRGLTGMTASQVALDAALTKFKLDARTLAASKRTQEATTTLEWKVGTAKAAFQRLCELALAALVVAERHRRLAEAVQGHGEAAEQDYYRGGR